MSGEKNRRLRRQSAPPAYNNKDTTEHLESREGDYRIAFAGDRRIVDRIIRKLQTEAFNNGQIKVRTRGNDGLMTVTTIPAASVKNGSVSKH